MARVIPGVQVAVVKDVLPPQLAPSGVLGLIGFTQKQPTRTERTSSWSRFIELFGAGSAYSLPEVRQALENGVFEVVVSPLISDVAISAAIEVAPEAFTLTATVLGTWANGFTVEVTLGQTLEGEDVFDLAFSDAANVVVEVHKKLSLAENSERNVETILAANSAIAHASAVKPGATLVKGKYILVGGKDANPNDYDASLAMLENEADVDMVIASVQDASEAKLNNVTKIYSKVIGHCERMSAESKGRIGFGQVLPLGAAAAYTEMTSNLVSDRFVMLAPHGVVGATAGRVGSLDYYRSPTFKTLSGLGVLARDLGVEEQRALLKGSVAPVVSQRGRGVIVIKGITTDGDQISVRRVADRAVRGVKAIGERFIGRMNNEDGRSALKQKLIEFLVQMEKESAIVPSTDGTDPAFKIDVYSSQADFAMGIVRVDVAVRPVRAIDFIYATILVQV